MIELLIKYNSTSTDTERCSEGLGAERSETAVLEVERCGGQAVDDSLNAIELQLFTDHRVSRLAEVRSTQRTRLIAGSCVD